MIDPRWSTITTITTFLLLLHSSNAFHNTPQRMLLSSHKTNVIPNIKLVSFETNLHSTILPTIPKDEIEENIIPSKGPLSMTIEELGDHLGGIGRAKAAWDCYRIGVEPLVFYDDQRRRELLQDFSSQIPIPSETSILDDDDEWEDNIASLLPSKRKNDGMGKNALKLLEELSGEIDRKVSVISNIKTSLDGTTKLLVKLLKDEFEVETVIIPWEERGSSTLCISSQIGCRQGCTFCATGRMGILRSLTSDEILSQVFHATKICRISQLPKIDNIVFMGMGEPADNTDAVTLAARILTDRHGFQMSQTKVTISTVAPTPQSFEVLGTAPCALAWSVHAANDTLRKKLVPTTNYSMNELRQGFMKALCTRPKKLRTTMLEVVLISEVNDTEEAARELAAFALEMMENVPGIKLVINLIPFNDIGHGTYRKPSPERVKKFQDMLMSYGIFTFVRTTRGDDEMAACGQLATKKKSERRRDVD